ncbi:hypothetical protein HIM_02343 [Hirsutella minnesotensis 3608]|nr:hypothetical protein HIM_02343 [Hirsutella minnesotensis 3608]
MSTKSAAVTTAPGPLPSAAPATVDAAAGYNRSACTECQRRKQKCNREWPCDRCQRRKIANECRYNHLPNNSHHAGIATSRVVTDPTLASSHHLVTGGDRESPIHQSPPLLTRGDSKASEADTPSLDTLAAARLFTTLGIDSKTKVSNTAPKEDFATPSSSPQIERVLKLLPQRPTMDKLVNIFTHDINYHYYIIYPPDFLRDYHIWWERRLKGRPITLQYTCLLAMICACCIQHADDAMQQELQQVAGLSADILSERLHCAVRELGSVIPVGHFHMYNVQRLLQSCYWYKAEARFLEAWHVLSAAVLEAKELGYHREPQKGTETGHECEMRRRLWCILDTWDWQISSGLSRPKIINREDCTAELPSLNLESFSAHAPSPLLHMKMQSELTRQLASRFSAPKNIIKPSEVHEYQVLIEAWMRKFPPVYNFDDPDMSKDAQYPWVFPHRYYVYTMACLLILNPIRHYMVKAYTRISPSEELAIRATGVAYSLKLLRTLRSWVDRIYNRDGRLHFIVFSIFDTAAILCTAVIKDNEHTLAERDEIHSAVTDAVSMLQRLNSISKISRTSYDLLERLARRLPQTAISRQDPSRKRAKVSSNRAQMHVEAVPASMPLPRPVHSLGSGNVTASTVGYGNQFDIAPAPPPILRSNCLSSEAVLRVPASMSIGPINDGRACSDYSTCSEGTPPSMDDHMMSSMSTISDYSAAPQMSLAQAVSNRGGQFPPPPAQDAGPDFELETVTQAQLGELAPLWNWHSENLNFTNINANPLAAGGMIGGMSEGMPGAMRGMSYRQRTPPPPL